MQGPTVPHRGTSLVVGTDVQAWRSILDKVYVHGADIASASTVNLDSATGDFNKITGTTTITAITLADGVGRVLLFAGACQLTAGASFILNGGGANVTTAAGDIGIVRGDSSGVVRLNLFRVSGKAVIPPTAADLGVGTSDSPVFAAVVSGTVSGSGEFTSAQASTNSVGFTATNSHAAGAAALTISNTGASGHSFTFGSAGSSSGLVAARSKFFIYDNTAGAQVLIADSVGMTVRNLYPTGGNGLAVATVGTLPVTAGTGLFEGAGFWVTDSSAASWTAGVGAIVAAGGSTHVPVRYDGTNWRIGG